jgi:5-methylcytosine-specific restriction endonuclease McrA
MTKRKSIPHRTYAAVFVRDRWLCQHCGRPVIFGPALKQLAAEVEAQTGAQPAYYDIRYSHDKAPLLDELAAVVDHVQPHSKSQDDSLGNLRTLCNKCNMRKGGRELADFERADTPPKTKGKRSAPTNWDGLLAVFRMYAALHPSRLTTIENKWLKAFEDLRVQKI